MRGGAQRFPRVHPRVQIIDGNALTERSRAGRNRLLRDVQRGSRVIATE
jgi:hypothetical protein